MSNSKLVLKDDADDNSSASVENTNSHISSERCLDLSMFNFWLLIYLPFGDPEFEIIHGKYMERDFLIGLNRGSEVKLRKNEAKVMGYVVSFCAERSYLEENFKRYTQEFREEFAAKILNIMKKAKNSDIIKNHKVCPTSKLIKIADKETQTSESISNDDRDIHQKYIDLQREHERVINLLTEVSTNLCETVKMMKKGGVSPVNHEKASSPERIPFGTSRNDENCPDDFTTSKRGQICLGPGGTKISSSVFNKIKWFSYTSATRNLLMALFPREILATHSLTGKPSPAFAGFNKEGKEKLNATVINDIVDFVSRKCGVTEAMVRGAITTKCADENKMFKRRMKNNLDEEDEVGRNVKKSRV